MLDASRRRRTVHPVNPRTRAFTLIEAVLVAALIGVSVLVTLSAFDDDALGSDTTARQAVDAVSAAVEDLAGPGLTGFGTTVTLPGSVTTDTLTFTVVGGTSASPDPSVASVSATGTVLAVAAGGPAGCWAKVTRLAAGPTDLPVLHLYGTGVPCSGSWAASLVAPADVDGTGPGASWSRPLTVP